jgi:hypothetical protein
VVLAELNIRHTRRHMPTRRVALGERTLPTEFGPLLLGTVVATTVEGLSEEQGEALDGFLREARGGLSVPRRALRFRLQTDTEGLALSRHRLSRESGALVLELDIHALYPAPQLLGAVMAAADLASYPRHAAMAALERAVRRPGELPAGVIVQYRTEALARPRPAAAAGPRSVDLWRGMPLDRRWAMEVLGFGPATAPEREEVLRRFRRLVRLAHPDHGGAKREAAERIVELAEARRVLLDREMREAAEG